ncbi:MAG: hypothetical protein A2915_03690 [Candidatus Yanofskybacteria bacterium RIFCSPLOWO2_01_FULL_41_34]|nr:MAG: hypothetical protein A2915_03690 [Candidatus Yanofskybacteria bacterium RIFCSPLOWO2_01_FULL_41_34]
MFKIHNLPRVLAIVPAFVWLFSFTVNGVGAFDFIRNVGDFLYMIFFVPSILFYDFIGFINFNILGVSTSFLEELTYILTSSAILYLIGKGTMKILGK